jgi:uroporphyrinogen decarboxylase
MINPLLENPAPDFSELERVLKGEQEPRRVHLMEHLIDQEVLQAIAERFLDEPWIEWDKSCEPLPPEAFLKQRIEMYYRLGYEHVPAVRIWANHPPLPKRWTADTADFSRGQREWVDQSGGLISNWHEFETFPWEGIRPNLTACERMARILPPGMKMTVSVTLFEHVLEYLLGYQGLFYLLHDEPELVAQVFDRWGQKAYEYYAAAIDMEQVGAILHPDDMGYKTSTLVSPDVLRQHVFPWLERYAALAHEHGKMFWIHSCGNHFAAGTIEDLIEIVKIDAFHSFQDEILPVIEFKKRYGHRVAALGGVDVDKLIRLDEEGLRAYLRNILEQCVPGGRFALGSGNSVTNYVPLENFCIMVDESRRYNQVL